jgi:hypothetical protein
MTEREPKLATARPMSRDEVRRVVEGKLIETPGRSDRLIAAEIGVDHKTVAAARKRVRVEAAKRVGADGRARRAPEPRPAPIRADISTASPQSGMPGVRWSAPRGRWKVVLRVNNEDHYYGLFDDLEVARRVCAQARLGHEYRDGRLHGDTTAKISDAEIAERFALDDDGDPFWREKPLVGEELQVRDNFRWNKRHGGFKLPERVKFKLPDGSSTPFIYAKDITKRLAAIRDAAEAGEALTSTPKVSDGEGEDAVSSGRAYGHGIPHGSDRAA